MQDARVRLALAVLGMIVLGGSGWAWVHARQAAPPPVVITSAPALPNTAPTVAQTPVPPTRKTVPPRIYVHVAGAVRHPWLYQLPSGSRVMQAVLAAGGPTSEADLDAVNLAEPVRDGEKVYVPVKQATLVSDVPPVPPGNTLGHASVVPVSNQMSVSPAPLPTVIEPGSASSAPGKHRSGGKGDKLTSPEQGQIGLNTADATQLERLPGVGPAMAARILAFREQAHGFQSIAEIQEVGGIGPKKFAKIAPFLTLN